jgi:hypothetical protein
MNLLDVLITFLETHRKRKLITCAPYCWCWNLEEVIMYMQIKEIISKQFNKHPASIKEGKKDAGSNTK